MVQLQLQTTPSQATATNQWAWLPSLRLALVIWRRNWHVFLKNAFTDVTGLVMEPIITLGAIGFGLGQFVGQMQDGQSYVEYVAPGIAAGYAMFNALFDSAFGFYMRMSSQRVVAHMLETPVEVQDLALGEMLWSGTRGMIACTIILTFAAALGLVASPWAVLVTPAGFLVGLAFAGIGISASAAARSMNSVTLVFTLLATPMYFFSGVFFPITSLPGFAQPLVWALPLTPGTYLIRGLMRGDVGWEHLAAALWLAVFSTVFFFLTRWLLRRRLIK
ncbi:MAG: hypothetical protein EXR67_01675 [Dehalococcoidia bacterium]|nr:hypothetical protein [Dehalococcoidia bacterium]